MPFRLYRLYRRKTLQEPDARQRLKSFLSEPLGWMLANIVAMMAIVTFATNGLANRMSSLEASFNNRMSSFESRMSSFENRMSAFENRMSSLETSVAVLKTELASAQQLFGQRFDRIDSRLDGIDRKLESVDSRLDSLESRMSAVEALATGELPVSGTAGQTQDDESPDLANRENLGANP